MVVALFDTNILIDFLNRLSEALKELAHYDQLAAAILKSFRVVLLDADIALRAVRLRRGNRIKLPDAIIWATAQRDGMLLVTRNTRDFRADHPAVRRSYQL